MVKVPSFFAPAISFCMAVGALVERDVRGRRARLHLRRERERQRDDGGNQCARQCVV